MPLVEPDQSIDIVIGPAEHSLAGPVFEVDLNLVARKTGLKSILIFKRLTFDDEAWLLLPLPGEGGARF